MLQQQDGSNPRPSFTDSAGKLYVLGDSLAVLTEPFVAIWFGKNYFGRNVLFGGVVLFGFLIAYPERAPALSRFATAWLAAIAFQVCVSRWNHYFGTRQITTYVGTPLVSYLLPFGDHFCRRVVTPLLLFGAGHLVEEPALASLFTFSAVGHLISCGFRYFLQSKQEDARSDALLSIRSQ